MYTFNAVHIIDSTSDKGKTNIHPGSNPIDRGSVL